MPDEIEGTEEVVEQEPAAVDDAPAAEVVNEEKASEDPPAAE